MEFIDITVLLLLGLGGWLWYDSLQVRECATVAARAACVADGLQLLDETVAIHRIGWRRNDDGQLRIQRFYDFEFSGTGNDRANGSIVMIGKEVLVINLNFSELPTRLLA